MAIEGYYEHGFMELHLEADLQRRGVETTPARYPYRDDLRLWLRPIHDFVRKYVDSFYADDAAVRTDVPLQAWKDELTDQARGAVRSLVPGDRLDSRQKWDLCHVARLYKWNHQLIEAQRLFRACLEVGTLPRGAVLRELVFADIDLGDWKAARAHYDELVKLNDKDFAAIRQAIELQLPTDG